MPITTFRSFADGIDPVRRSREHFITNTNLNALDAVVDDIPFGASFDYSQHNCSCLEQSRQEATNTISEYISPRPTRW